MPEARAYLGDGRLELDNNICERSIRPVAPGRKNCLFPGSVGGGEAAAIAYALIETAKMNNVDPEAWLTWVLERIADHRLTPSTNSCRGTGSPKTSKTRPDRTDTLQDRDGAVDLMKAIRYRSPWPRHPFADSGHAGDRLKDALSGHGQWTIEIIGCSDTAEGFEVLPREWVVERTFAWLGGCRRLARDWERSIESSTAWATIAHIRILTRRLARLLSYLNNFSVRL